MFVDLLQNQRGFYFQHLRMASDCPENPSFSVGRVFAPKKTKSYNRVNLREDPRPEVGVKNDQRHWSCRSSTRAVRVRKVRPETQDRRVSSSQNCHIGRKDSSGSISSLRIAVWELPVKRIVSQERHPGQNRVSRNQKATRSQQRQLPGRDRTSSSIIMTSVYQYFWFAV